MGRRGPVSTCSCAVRPAGSRSSIRLSTDRAKRQSCSIDPKHSAAGPLCSVFGCFCLLAKRPPAESEDEPRRGVVSASDLRDSLVLSKGLKAKRRRMPVRAVRWRGEQGRKAVQAGELAESRVQNSFESIGSLCSELATCSERITHASRARESRSLREAGERSRRTQGGFLGRFLLPASACLYSDLSRRFRTQTSGEQILLLTEIKHWRSSYAPPSLHPRQYGRSGFSLDARVRGSGSIGAAWAALAVTRTAPLLASASRRPSPSAGVADRRRMASDPKRGRC